MIESLPARERVDFVDRLDRFSDATAVLSDGAVLSYRDLDQRVEQVADRLGRTRRLVLLHAANTVESVVAYLGALRGGHPVIVADAARRQLLAELLSRFDPDVVIAGPDWTERRLGSRHELHPDLAVLLSTSGSTGSPKLVRLSRRNLNTNAAAIAQYLSLDGSDRAITSLPLGYCYGLSVLHSHLSVGASLVLTERSVTDPGFWRLFTQTEATSFAAVPHTFALLDRLENQWYAAPHLRYVTQAGGRLPPDEVRRIDRLGRAHGWQLFVMYGQTEATARIAYVPPDQLAAHPHCIGRAIPGGHLRIDNPGPDGAGELVYTGPNVMMGYAAAPEALAEGPGLTELQTGDLARPTTTGLFEIVGRRSRFAKLLGHRVDLDRVQQMLSTCGESVVCTSDDHDLIIAVATADSSLLRRQAARLTGLPPGLIRVQQYAEIPRLTNGKPDYQAIKQPPPTASAVPAQDRGRVVRDLYAEFLGYDQVDESASFIQLGGDSLSFVEVSIHLERLLGDLPDNWAAMPIRDLTAEDGPPRAAPSTAAPSTAAPSTAAASTAAPRIGAVDTGIALRAVAITLVVLAHLEIWGVRGGGHLLLVLAGFSFARFPLAAVRLTDRVSALAVPIARIAIPSMLFIGVVVAFHDGYGLPNVFLLNHYLGPPGWSERWNFWFIETLVEILVVALLMLSIPWIRRFERRHTLLLPALILGVGLLVRYDAFGWSDIAQQFGRPHTVFWIFALGWLAERASTPTHRVLAGIVALVAFHGYFPGDPTRQLVIQAGVLLLLWLPRLRLPGPLIPPVRLLAAGSLWIYLTHWIVWPICRDDLHLPPRSSPSPASSPASGRPSRPTRS